MSTLNVYATLAEYKAYSTERMQTTSTDTNDDAVIEDILEASSRYLDSQTGRWFYPRYQTRYLDTPEGRDLVLDSDLLEVSSVTNGDDDTVSSSDYNLWPKNESPYREIHLKSSTSEYWSLDGSGNEEAVIDVAGFWGYHNDYTNRAWVSGGTLGAEIASASAATFTMAAGHTLAAGQIVKIGSELMNVSSVSTNTITPVKRGDNGSTAASHAIGAPVYVWHPQADIKEATLSLAHNLYARRTGQTSQGHITVTASGVVIRPEDVPPLVQALIMSYRDML